ncbi:MAG: nucleotidyltransferase domain-containing protein [Verrucomicrobiae bacterium]|nr:nucleotidyltransferase domain-containing protein [Verrucomicrobiae bacterium]
MTLGNASWGLSLPASDGMGVVVSAEDLARRRATGLHVAGRKMAENPGIIGVMLIGSSARGEARPESDVDLLLFNATTMCDDWLVRHYYESHDGYMIECNEIAASAGLDVEKALSDAYWVSGVHDGLVLLDPQGRLTSAQQRIRAAFMEPARLRRRLGPVIETVGRNVQGLHGAVEAKDRAVFCWRLSFALWTIGDALLVRRGRAPSRFHGLERLRASDPDEWRTMLQLQGLAEVSAAEALEQLAFFEERRVIVGGTLGAFRGMAGRGAHREALHVAWSELGLFIRERVRAGEEGGLAAAGATAEKWLSRLGWDDDVLAAKAPELAGFFAHVGWACDGGLPSADTACMGGTP